MRQLMTALGASALLMMVGIAAPATAQADPACAEASVEGTLTGTRQVGPYCVPTPRPVLCVTRWAGFTPHVLVTVRVCVPV